MTLLKPLWVTFLALQVALMSGVVSGACDVAVTDIQGNLHYIVGHGDGTFGPPVVVGTVSGPYDLGVGLGDFDRDGDLDIVVGEGNGIVSLFVNDGTDHFAKTTASSMAASGIATDPFAVADFNNDGWLDIVGSYHWEPSTDSGQFDVFTNNQDGTFTRSSIAHSIGDLTPGKGAGDFNNDGNQDFVAVRYHASNVYLYLGNGGGSFAGGLAFSFPNTETPALVAADFNRDGKVDVLGGNDDDGDAGQTWVAYGNGDATFAAPVEAFDLAPGAESGWDNQVGGQAIAGDFNGDGAPDVMLLDIYSRRLYYVENVGDGTFHAPVSVAQFDSTPYGIGSGYSVRGGPGPSVPVFSSVAIPFAAGAVSLVWRRRAVHSSSAQ